jgi:hypothetical protein
MINTIRAKEKFVFNLLNPEDRPGKTTLLYIVFKTIENNTGITLNQLRWILDAEYMIPNDVVSSAVAALTSKSLFNCVSRWQPPKAAGQPRNDAVHLRIRKDCEEFSRWHADALKEFPELNVFVPPVFAVKQNNQQSAPTVVSNEG